MTPAPYPESGTTKRLRRSIRQRQVVFQPVGPSAGAALDAAPYGAEAVYLCGPRPPEGWRSWAVAGLGEFWFPGAHYYESAVAPIMRYQHLDGREVQLLVAAQWFGDQATPAEAHGAWCALAGYIAGAFDGATLLATPATTGRELFLRSIPYGREWPVLPMEVQDAIRSTSGQGRIEVLEPAAEEVPALFEYDGRLMYAALCWGLPAGVPQWDDRPEYAGQVRGRYLVDAAVPRDWPERFGLLGVKAEGGAWRYPSEPGETFSTWCDGAELAVALAQSWPVTIRERLLFPSLPGKGPLDNWAAKLVKIRDQVEAAGGAEAALVMAGLRALLLHGIGAFHGRGHLVTHSLPLDRAAEVPAAAVGARVEGDRVVWGESTGQRWAAMAHPEWSAAIWSRARARLLHGPQATGALHRRGEVVAFRTDALYLTERQRWTDDARPGRLRLVRYHHGRLPWPASNSELLRLRPAMTAVGR